MDGDVRCVGHESACCIEHGAREVEALPNVDRRGRGLQGETHLLGHGHEAVVEDLKQDRISVRADSARGLGGRAGKQQVALRRDLRAPPIVDKGGRPGFEDERRALQAKAGG